MASLSGNNKIDMRADWSPHDEGIVSGAVIYPGMNVNLGVAAAVMEVHSYAPGGTDTVGTGTGATTVTGSMKIATELLNVLQGKTVNDSYPVGEAFSFFVPRRGDSFQVLVTSGQNFTKHDTLTAQSTGKFSVDASNPTVEVLEGSGGALAADTLVRVRCL